MFLQIDREFNCWVRGEERIINCCLRRDGCTNYDDKSYYYRVTKFTDYSYIFLKYILRSYQVSGTVLGAYGISANKIKRPCPCGAYTLAGEIDSKVCPMGK